MPHFRSLLCATTAPAAFAATIMLAPVAAHAAACDITGIKFGILATTTAPGAKVTIDTFSNVAVAPDTPGQHTVGIQACSSDGGITESITGDVTSDNGEVMRSFSQSGDISITLNSGLMSGLGLGGGIIAKTDGAGSVTINVAPAAEIYSSSGLNGVAGVSQNGDLTYDIEGAVKDGGVSGAVTGTGSASVKIGAAIASSAGDGLRVSTATGDALVSTTATGLVSGGGSGIVVLAEGGNVTAATKGAVTGNTAGVYLATTGVGNATAAIGANVNAGGAAGVTVTSVDGVAVYSQSAGAVTAFLDGVDVATISGAAIANIGAGAAITTASPGAHAGLDLVSTTGSISVSNAGAISDGGLVASTGGAITVVNSGTINNSAGAAAALNAGGPSTLVNTAGAVMTGLGDTQAHAAITATSSKAAPFALTNAGVITTGDLTNAGNAIDVNGKNATIDNQAGGMIDGRIHTGAGAAFSNEGTWETRGTSAFGGAGTSTIINTGLVHVGRPDPATKTATTTFSNLGTFQNGSSTATGTVSLMNGKVGDTLVVDGDFHGQKNHSVLILDAFLGGPGSTADLLQVNGASSGQTKVQINDTNTGAGAVNKAGIQIISGATGKSDFILDPAGPHYDAALNGIDHGFFVYTLKYKGGDDFLVGSVGGLGAAAPAMLTAVQDIFDSLGFGPGGIGAPAPGLMSVADADHAPRVWMSSLNWRPSQLNTRRNWMWGAGLASDGDADLGGFGLSQRTATVGEGADAAQVNTGFAQQTSALMTGVDLVRGRRDGAAWALGLSSGYVASDQVFSLGGSAMSYEGAAFGAYGRYLKGAFRLDAAVRGDLLKARYLASDYGGAGGDAGVSTVGLEMRAAYARPVGHGLTLEPSAFATAQTTHFGDLALYGVAMRFDDAASVKAGVGLKLSGARRLGGWTLTGSLAGRMWREFEDQNTSRLTGFEDQLLADHIGGSAGDVTGALNLGAKDGRTGLFLAGTYRVNTVYESAGINAGLKLRW